jgi:GT2 family glycosyltransferase
MDISVIVPTFNRREIVARTLATLFAQTFPSASFEIIVVVDGSRDGTAAALKSLKPSCRLRVIEQENGGPSAARNTGYRSAEADLVLFLDDDMLCDPGLVTAHVAAHKEPGRVVAFGALFLSADSPPSLAAECFNREIGAFYLEQKRSPETAWQITNCVFSNSSLPRALLAEFGGFDESFRMREDLELGTRLFAAGVRPRYISNAIAYQHYGKTAADLLRDAEAFAVADVLFAHKHPEAQIQGHLNGLEKEQRWKRAMRRFAADSPAFEVCFLAPLCSLGQMFLGVSALRNIGVRALQMRRRIHWLRAVRRLTTS